MNKEKLLDATLENILKHIIKILGHQPNPDNPEIKFIRQELESLTNQAAQLRINSLLSTNYMEHRIHVCERD